MYKVVVLISGEGTNLQSLIDCAGDRYEIVGVVTNVPSAGGIRRAEKHNIPCTVVDHTVYDTREEFDMHLTSAVKCFNPDLVVLSGFMRILTDVFVNAFTGMCINIHPSLLPKYKGLNTHERAIKAGDQEAGCTIHFVTLELDGGPTIQQIRVPISSLDTPIKLKSRVQRAEHAFFVAVVTRLASKQLYLNADQQTVNYKGGILPPTGLVTSFADGY